MVIEAEPSRGGCGRLFRRRQERRVQPWSSPRVTPLTRFVAASRSTSTAAAIPFAGTAAMPAAKPVSAVRRAARSVAASLEAGIRDYLRTRETTYDAKK